MATKTATKSVPKTKLSPLKKNSNGVLPHKIVSIDSKKLKDMENVFSLQKKKALELRHSTTKQRIKKLKSLKDLIFKYQPEIREALRADFNKSETETDLSEILPSIAECRDAIRHLKYWMKPVRANTPITLFGAVSEIHYEPRGTVLIIAPWNYPFHLAFAPIVGAIAAGNTVILKPSEYTPHTSALTKKMLAELFPEEEVAVFEGDHTVSTALTDLPFDHIFFTGSTNVGKIIMERASKHLTSVTLELGGKSPAIITDGADIKKAAHSILWGKFLNAGQTCVAPDYLLIPESKVDDFVEQAKKTVKKFFGSETEDKSSSKDFCRIVNARNFERVSGYIKEAVIKGAKIELGGEVDASQNFIAPTILSKIPKDSKIMEDEIFGPVLPIITYKNLDEAIDFVNSKPKPLALYIFTKDEKKINKILKSTSSGGAVINDLIIHLANSHLPFGGVNHSGHGSYHGFFGFKQFSHERSVLKQSPVSAIKMMYPPYNNLAKKLVDITTKYLA
ncbi:aldehyde dehydrogenase family protein [Leptospira sp. GIMC2001]|uniref:aldehyde dehydrogenase family protein n=1 Tax=Leptospira sp. GIMC2001 TaxID=1513297 RepID=UPI00234B1A97|nr:aldehyde dehydrogenase family protein [Leptospira sp. GIMC2001]WCL50567.1 aldehyde dehydrogenase family protein [Leptospira sp. GIMC2001]